MNTHITGLARKRLRWVGILAAMLAWGMGAIEFISYVAIWVSDRNGMLTVILSAFANGVSPLLDPFTDAGEVWINPGLMLSPLSAALIIVLDALPQVLVAYMLWLTGVFFLRLSRGETWTDRNVRMLWVIGVLCIISPATFPIALTLQSLALSIDLPAGERIVHVSAGMSSYAASEVVKGILLCSFSTIMRDAKVLSDEQSQYI